MKFPSFKFIQFLAVVPFFSLGQFGIQDQFKNNANWNAFSGVTKVVVMQGRGVQDKSQSAQWGNYLAQKYNQNFKPNQDNVKTLNPKEIIKIIPMASLPHVPGPFKGMAVSGVMKQSPDYGVLLDYDSTITGRLGYNEKDNSTPGVAIFPADANVGKSGNQVQVIMGFVGDENVRAQVDAAIQAQLAAH